MSRKIDSKAEEKIGWDLAIAEAESQLKEWRGKVARQMASLETFREAKKQGKRLPGEPLTDN